MPEIKKLLKLSKIEYLKTHLSIINCIIPKDTRMTPSEIKVLATFMDIGDSRSKHRFGTTSRKIIMDRLGISISNLSNYFKSLQDKGILVKKDGTLLIHPILIPNNNEQHYKFVLLVKEEKKQEDEAITIIENTKSVSTLNTPDTEIYNNMNTELSPRDNAIINLGWTKLDKIYKKKNYTLSFETDKEIKILKDNTIVFIGDCEGLQDLKSICLLLKIQ